MNRPTARLVLGLSSVLLVALPQALAAEPARGGPASRELRMMDADGDGKISAEEHAAGALKMFETMDANQDGSVTAAEMDAAHERITGEKAKRTDMSSAEKIRVIDTDGDGRVSAEEHAAGSRTLFQRMDANGDGQLTAAELAAGHRKLMRKGGR